MSDFNGLGLHLGNLARLSNAQSRSLSPENFDGAAGGVTGGAACFLPRLFPFLSGHDRREAAAFRPEGAVAHIFGQRHRVDGVFRLEVERRPEPGLDRDRHADHGADLWPPGTGNGWEVGESVSRNSLVEGCLLGYSTLGADSAWNSPVITSQQVHAARTHGCK